MPKVTVAIPDDLLSEVDDAAVASQMNRSAFICQSLRAQLRSERLEQLRRKVQDDVEAIARSFHDYWNPLDESMWMAAENEPLTLVNDRTSALALFSDEMRGSV
jgi:Arc/MetJ-type ribon-helix-helix transcriptional regulator